MKRTTAFSLTRAHFTLLELLIVIAIIAILAGMLLPALQAARIKALENGCRSNIKQVHLAEYQYTMDNRFMRYDWTRSDTLARDRFVVGDPLIGYLNLKNGAANYKKSAFYCPGTLPEWRTALSMDSSYGFSTFVFSGEGSTTISNFPNRAAQWEKVQKPSKTILRYEGGTGWASSKEPTRYAGQLASFEVSYHGGTIISGGRLHPKGATKNVLFFDGHAASFSVGGSTATLTMPSEYTGTGLAVFGGVR